MYNMEMFENNHGFVIYSHLTVSVKLAVDDCDLFFRYAFIFVWYTL